MISLPPTSVTATVVPHRSRQTALLKSSFSCAPTGQDLKNSFGAFSVHEGALTDGAAANDGVGGESQSRGHS